jgi:hypothetical protein
MKTIKAPSGTAYNNGIVVRGGRPPLSQIAKVICGRAFVSVHLRPVSTHSLRSFGHSSQVLGTQAQYKLATSQCLNVGCNVAAKAKKRAKSNTNPKFNTFSTHVFQACLSKFEW